MTLHIEDIAPNFSAETTQGSIDFHAWAGGDWVVFFSHPRDFTPVCTTELGTVAKLREAFAARGAKALAISVDSLKDHHGWVGDIEETQGEEVNFPIVADPDHRVANLYGMIPPHGKGTTTVRSVFFIDPNKKIRAMITYPASTGRDFNEIVRVLDSLQLTDKYQVATPANWQKGDDVVISPALQDPAELATKFPKGFKALKPYLRLTPDPES